MKLSLSICQQFSYNRFSKVAHNIFFKFCMKLEDFKGQKLRTKLSFWGKSLKTRKSGSPIITQHALFQSDCGILQSSISLKWISWYLVAIKEITNHQGKVASQTTSSGWVWRVAPPVHSDCQILWSSISLKRINWYLSFLHGDNHQV